jgi:hypothetical protein
MQSNAGLTVPIAKTMALTSKQLESLLEINLKQNKNKKELFVLFSS